MLREIGVHVLVVPIKDGADLERAEIRVVAHDIESGAVGILDLAQGGDPHGRRQFFHPALERFQLHHGAEGFDPLFILRRGLGGAALHRVVMRGRHLRDEGANIELEQFLEFLGVTVGGRLIVAVVHPKHRNVRLHLRHQMQNHRFVGSEVRRDDRPPTGLRDGPANDLPGVWSRRSALAWVI